MRHLHFKRINFLTEFIPTLLLCEFMYSLNDAALFLVTILVFVVFRDSVFRNCLANFIPKSKLSEHPAQNQER